MPHTTEVSNERAAPRHPGRPHRQRSGPRHRRGRAADPPRHHLPPRPAGERVAGYEYQREGNPTNDRLREALKALEGGEEALTFASGMAAMTTLLESLPAGSRVLFPDDCYSGLRMLFGEFLPERGILVETVDMADLDAVHAACAKPLSLLWIETPSNPLLKISDIAALAELGHAAGALVVVDNTFATPLLQRPLALGADVVMHSTTKYFGGHSDVLGGALVFARDDAFARKVAHRLHVTGAVLAPFSAWLTLRGCRSLGARMAMHCANARKLAEFLAAHPAVERVNWPGLPSHPGHAVAAKQMREFGAMLSVELRGGREAALAVAGRLRIFTNATSLGGCESLVEHRASVEGPNPRSPQNLLRVSVGLEDGDDLIADFAQALG
ncbi:trans-sulfuration enzyme family protein [Thermomonas brevis]|uniref:trans-sulfuration enzyme family protein n=1 Tax=Thermomonas brevis TaxID=215691 RepID=UPI001FE8D5DD|nr:PLP-dependent transferase [Thermomonas brevis]